ncbi:MAG TPA: aromatic ring-hydroxylating dioxygenase subunit alpha [Acetobacteraceae bacterium]|nr:aromatic ring-hydroxylating dioxygenase subunit alpha [Acetobacteraceae bacterium]
MTEGSEMRALLGGRRRHYSLPQKFYTDPAFYELDLKGVFERRWIFAGLECELKEPGDYLTLSIARSSVVVLRDDDETIAAFFNTCRHRGSTICPPGHGAVGALTCPYHQWTYDLKGKLVYAGEMHAEFDPKGIALKPVSVATFAGMVFVCLCEDPPDFAEFSDTLGPFLVPHDLTGAKLAWSEDIVINANWKLVVENSRECYHCDARHPELVRTFYTRFDATSTDAAVIEHARTCREAGLKTGQAMGDDFQLSRMPLTGGARTLSMDGTAVCAKRLGNVPDADIGSMRWFQFPSMFAHVLSDYAFFFRLLPLGVDRTLVTSNWYVSAAAEEGRDYETKTLSKLWSLTNDQDRDLCERNQEGIASLGYQPGPYSEVREGHVAKFVEWYADTMADYLGPDSRRAVRAA